MKQESYTPGHSENAKDFMSKRSFEAHGRFVARHIEDSPAVFGVGCGPGLISLEIAAAVASRRVHGIDFAESQIESVRGLKSCHQSGRGTSTGFDDRVPGRWKSPD